MIARMPANRIVPLVGREALGAAHFLLTFRHPETAREARPGQFVMIKAGLSAEPPLRRPFSILSVDAARETVTLFVKAIGQGSRALCAMAPGDEAQCLGPLGRPFTPPPAGDGSRCSWPAATASPRSASWATSCGARVARARLFYGGRTAADLVLLDRLGGSRPDGGAGHRGRQPRRARPRHRPPRGVPRRGLRARRASTPAARTR